MCFANLSYLLCLNIIKNNYLLCKYKRITAISVMPYIANDPTDQDRIFSSLQANDYHAFLLELFD